MAKYSFYEYLKTITVVKNKPRLYDNILFSADYPQQFSQTQRLLKESCHILFALQSSFSTNEVTKDIVHGGHLDINAKKNDVGMILLALFVL